MKKIITVLFMTLLFSGIYAQKAEPQPQPDEIPMPTSKDICKKADDLANEIFKLFTITMKTPKLKNPAMVKFFKEAWIHFEHCDIENALVSLDKFLNIASQDKYDVLGKDKLENAGVKLRKYMIECYKVRCKKKK